jgi:outer membrane protein assembly factor BamB
MLFLNHSGWIKAFDLETGSVMWMTDLDVLGSIDLSIMTQNASHLFLGRRGEVIRLSKSSGAIDLTIRLDSLKQGDLVQDAFDPVVAPDNLLYVPTFYRPPDQPYKGNLFCYNAQTGDYVWGIRVPDRKVYLSDLGDSVSASTGLEKCAVEDSLVVICPGQFVYAFNRFTGQKVWERFFEHDAFDVSLTIEGGRIYLGSINPGVFALELVSGQTLWHTKTKGGGSIQTILSIAGSRLYFCDSSRLWVVDIGQGAIMWNGFPPEYISDRFAVYLSPVAVGEGYMVNVGSKRVYCLTVPP